MDTLNNVGEVTFHKMSRHSHGDGLEYLNSPTSFEVSSLLSKLNRIERERHPRQRQHEETLIQRVKMIELDPYYHNIPQSEPTQPPVSACYKTRLFLAVAYGAHAVVAQLFALELRHDRDDVDESSQGEGGLEDDDELEWIDVSHAMVLTRPENRSVKSGDGVEIAGTEGPVVIFPPSYAEYLPSHLHLRDQTKIKAPDLFVSKNYSGNNDEDFTADITCCALIPAPAIRIPSNASTYGPDLKNNTENSKRTLTQRTVAVVLGTSHDQVLSLSLHVSEVSSDASLTSSCQTVPLTAETSLEAFANVKFVLEYDTHKFFEDGKLHDALGRKDYDSTNRIPYYPVVHQVLPPQQKHKNRFDYCDKEVERHDGDSFDDCNSTELDSGLGESGTTIHHSSYTVNIFDGSVDASVQVFHPTLPSAQVRTNVTNENNSGVWETKHFRVTSISFCRGNWNSKHLIIGNLPGKEAMLNQDVIWITYGNGTIMRLPSWKFFLSFGCREKVCLNGGGHTDMIEGNSFSRVCNDDGVGSGARVPSHGLSVIPLNGCFQSPLDIPPPQSHHLNSLARPNHGDGGSVLNNAHDSIALDDRSREIANFEDRTKVNKELNFWCLLSSAISQQLIQSHNNGEHYMNQPVQALILTGQSVSGSSLPLAFQSSRVKYAPPIAFNNPTNDESLDVGSAMQCREHGSQVSGMLSGHDDAKISSSSSEADLYGPMTGTVVGGTAALVKGALGMALGAFRWGLGRRSEAEEHQQDGQEEETPFGCSMAVDEKSDGRHSDSENILSDESGKALDAKRSSMSFESTQKSGHQVQTLEEGEYYDLFPWPLSSASFSYSDVPRRFLSAIVDPSGSLVATTDNLGRVMLFDLETNQPIRMWKGMRNVSCYFAELPHQGYRCVEDSMIKTWLYLVIHLPQRGAVEVYRLRQGRRVAAVAVPQQNNCVVIECYGPPSEGSIIRCFLLERINKSDERNNGNGQFIIDYLVVEDSDALADTIVLKEKAVHSTLNSKNKMQLNLLMQLLAPDTNIACNAQTVLATFMNIRALADLSEVCL